MENCKKGSNRITNKINDDDNNNIKREKNINDV